MVHIFFTDVFSALSLSAMATDHDELCVVDPRHTRLSFYPSLLGGLHEYKATDSGEQAERGSGPLSDVMFQILRNNRLMLASVRRESPRLSLWAFTL